MKTRAPIRSCDPIHFCADIEADAPGLRNVLASLCISHPRPFHKNVTVIAEQSKEQLLQNASVRALSQNDATHRVRMWLGLTRTAHLSILSGVICLQIHVNRDFYQILRVLC